MWLSDALRAGERHSVPDLARRLGVSSRTIARDLALLRDQELPIEGIPGPGGGVRLHRRAEATARLALTDDEVAALWLSVWVGAVHSRPDAAGPAASAIRKVEAVLPHDQRQRLRALASRILVGAAAGRHLLAGASLPRPAVIAALASALEASSVTRIEYVDAQGANTSRLVEPHALLVQVPLWYLLALDRDREAPRTFRLDRVLAATPLRGRTFRPVDLLPLFPDLVHAGVDVAALPQPASQSSG